MWNWARAVTVFLALTMAHADAAVIVVSGSSGPGVDFTSLQNAIGAAQNGDVLLLKPGSYGPALIQGKSLTLAKYSDFAQVGGLIVQNLTADQTVVLRGLTLTHIVVTPPPIVILQPLQVRTCEGVVAVEDCELAYTTAIGTDRAAAIVTQSSRVVFSRCALTGGVGSPTEFDPFVGGVAGGQALRAIDSKVWLHGSTLRGGDGGTANDLEQSPTNGGAGIRAENAWVWVFGCAVRGGDGKHLFDFEQGFDDISSPGPGLSLLGTFAITQDSTIEAGRKATDTAPPMPAIVGTQASSVPGIPALLELNSPVDDGGTIHVRVRGQPGHPAVLLAGASRSFVQVPLVLGMLQVGPPAVLVGLGSLPSNGAIEFDANAGHLPPGVEVAAATVQVHVAGQGILPASLSNPETLLIVNP
jgi:hypothetical protein